jgi:hypothetical protein
MRSISGLAHRPLDSDESRPKRKGRRGIRKDRGGKPLHSSADTFASFAFILPPSPLDLSVRGSKQIF